MTAVTKRRTTRRIWPSSIPRDIYEHVKASGVEIVNATGRSDDKTAATAYKALRLYWRNQERAGRTHPFLPEMVADFTDSPHARVRLYYVALRLARQHRVPQDHTILLSLGTVQLELGHRRAACRSYAAAEANARLWRDRESVREARRLLRQAGGRPTIGIWTPPSSTE